MSIGYIEMLMNLEVSKGALGYPGLLFLENIAQNRDIPALDYSSPHHRMVIESSG